MIFPPLIIAYTGARTYPPPIMTGLLNTNNQMPSWVRIIFQKKDVHLARLRWGLNCVIISGSIWARLNCNGHVIMEIDIMGADMRSYIKAGYGRHDLL